MSWFVGNDGEVVRQRRTLLADTIIPDPFNAGDWNRYNYTRFNPVTYKDPTGHWGCRPGLDGGNCGSTGELTFLLSDQENQRLGMEQAYRDMSKGYAHIPSEVQNQVVDQINEVIVGAIFEPVDTLYTIQDIADNGLKWYHPFAFMPILSIGMATGFGNIAEGTLSGIAKNTDEIIEVTERHHTILRQILNMLPEPLRRAVWGKKGTPNIWPIPKSIHRTIHSGPGGGGYYNDLWRDEIGQLIDMDNLNPLAILNLRDEIVNAFGLSKWKP